ADLCRAEESGDRNGGDGQCQRDDEEPDRPERKGGEHQRRVLRWCSHCSTSVLVLGELPRCSLRGPLSVSERFRRTRITQGTTPLGRFPVGTIGADSDCRWPATREVNSGSTSTLPYSRRLYYSSS